MKIFAYTDGANRGNQFKEGRIGAWAYAIYAVRDGKLQVVKEDSSLVLDETNNVNELMALINVMAVIQKPCVMDIVTDSKYAVACFDGCKEWKARGWRNSSGHCKNVEWLERILAERSRLEQLGVRMSITRVDGHSGIEGNEYCDRKCNEIMDAYEAFKKAKGVKGEEK